MRIKFSQKPNQEGVIVAASKYRLAICMKIFCAPKLVLLQARCATVHQVQPFKQFKIPVKNEITARHSTEATPSIHLCFCLTSQMNIHPSLKRHISNIQK